MSMFAIWLLVGVFSFVTIMSYFVLSKTVVTVKDVLIMSLFIIAGFFGLAIVCGIIYEDNSYIFKYKLKNMKCFKLMGKCIDGIKRILNYTLYDPKQQ